MSVRMSTLPRESQYLGECYIGSYSQLLFTYPPDRMQNPGERKACHTKSLGRHSSRADKLVSTDQCPRLAVVPNLHLRIRLCHLRRHHLQHLLRIRLAVIQQPDSFHLCHARRALHLRHLHLQRRIEHNKRFSHLPLLLSVRCNTCICSLAHPNLRKYKPNNRYTPLPLSSRGANPLPPTEELPPRNHLPCRLPSQSTNHPAWPHDGTSPPPPGA